MSRNAFLIQFAMASLTLAALGLGCGGGSRPESITSTGGIHSTGGATAGAATGGAPRTGGTTTTGGSPASGGSVGAGGTLATGGNATSSGGCEGCAGGALATGGASASGGAGTGGVSLSGGAGTGGDTSTGGIKYDAGQDLPSRTGGTIVTGGTTVTGGAATGGTRTGGTIATGGTTASGGQTSTGVSNTGALATNCPAAVPAGITAEWCNCDQWGELHKGDVTYYNDIWGSGAGPQCIWVAGEKWGVASNHPSGNSVKSYPNISYSPKKLISAINSYTSQFDLTVPSGGAWEYAYDIWVKSSSGTMIEIMLWVDYTQGKVFPAGSLGVSNVTTGGSTWNVYYGAYGGHDVISLLRTTNTSSSTVDIKDILNWLMTNKKTFDNSWSLDQVQFGPEIVSDGAVHGYIVNSFSVSSS